MDIRTVSMLVITGHQNEDWDPLSVTHYVLMACSCFEPVVLPRLHAVDRLAVAGVLKIDSIES